MLQLPASPAAKEERVSFGKGFSTPAGMARESTFYSPPIQLAIRADTATQEGSNV